VRLPVLPLRVQGQAALELDQPDADKVLAQFEGKGNTPE